MHPHAAKRGRGLRLVLAAARVPPSSLPFRRYDKRLGNVLDQHKCRVRHWLAVRALAHSYKQLAERKDPAEVAVQPGFSHGVLCQNAFFAQADRSLHYCYYLLLSPMTRSVFCRWLLRQTASDIS